MRKKTVGNLVALVAIVAVALAVRLYKINTPLADWHSWRQSDTASVTREFVKHNYPIWESHYQDLSNIPSGLENPNGYRMVEFPILNYVIAHFLRYFHQFDLVVTSRLVSVGFSLISVVSLFGIVYLLTRRSALALLSSLAFAILPYSVYYSRVILPEPAMIATQLVSLWMFIAWLQRPTTKKVGAVLLFIGSVIFFALSLLLKPTAIFIVPVFIVLAFAYKGLGTFKNVWLWALAILSVIPLVLWRQWITHFPAGIPASAWLLNGNGIRLHPAWWRWLFADRLARLILGYWGVVLLTVGTIGKLAGNISKKHLFDVVTIVWTLSMLAYLVIFATGNVQHDYYQTLLVPVISILVARGIIWLWETAGHTTYRIVTIPMLGLVCALSLFFAWWEVRGYYNINNPAIVAAGMRVDALTPPDAKVIAPYGGDTAFLFQTNRTGWPVGGLIDQRIGQGAQYYVTTTNDDEAQQLAKKYRVLEKTNEYLIIDLTHKAS